MPAALALEYHLTKKAKILIYEVLEKVFKIPRKRIKIKLTWRNPLGGRWKVWGTTIPIKRNEYLVGLNPRCAQSDALFKGTCAHEAIHIAYLYYSGSGKLEKFWECLTEYVPIAIEHLKKYYGNTEEFLVAVLEPLVALVLVPPADTAGWDLLIIEPPPQEGAG